MHVQVQPRRARAPPARRRDRLRCRRGRQDARGSGATIEGIVGFADLALGDAVEEVLRAHEEAAGGLFRGVRHATAWSSDPDDRYCAHQSARGLLGDPTFRAGAAKLASMGHSFDAWLFHPQLDELVAFARACPSCRSCSTTSVPRSAWASTQAPRRGPSAGQLRWRTGDVPNVTLKIGGIGMDNYFGTGWTAATIPPVSRGGGALG